MALILAFVNTTDLAPTSDYRVEVLIGDGTVARSKTIARGVVKGHVRDHGWEVLVRKFLDGKVEKSS